MNTFLAKSAKLNATQRTAKTECVLAWQPLRETLVYRSIYILPK